MIELERMATPAGGDVVTFTDRPGRTYRIEQVRGHHVGEGWAVELVDTEDPLDRFGTSLHEEQYPDRRYWDFVR